MMMKLYKLKMKKIIWIYFLFKIIKFVNFVKLTFIYFYTINNHFILRNLNTNFVFPIKYL